MLTSIPVPVIHVAICSATPAQKACDFCKKVESEGAAWMRKNNISLQDINEHKAATGHCPHLKEV